METWGVWIIQTITMLGVGAVAWFIKQSFSAMDKRVKDIEEKVDQLPYLYVQRDDFIRAMATVDSSIMRLGDKVDRKFDQVLDQIGKRGS